MATVLPLRTAWIADILSQASLRDVQRQHCWKRGSRGGQRLWDYSTTERSFNVVSALCVAVERQGSMLTMNCLQGHRRQPIAKSGKFVRGLFADSVGLQNDDGLVLSLIVEHTSRSLRGVLGRGRDLTWQPAVTHQSPAAKATNRDSCNRAAAQVKKRIPEQRTASTEPISKKGIKLIPKTIGYRKEDCA